jgi:hypothetical protein
MKHLRVPFATDTALHYHLGLTHCNFYLFRPLKDVYGHKPLNLIDIGLLLIASTRWLTALQLCNFMKQNPSRVTESHAVKKELLIFYRMQRLIKGKAIPVQNTQPVDPIWS